MAWRQLGGLASVLARIKREDTEEKRNEEKRHFFEQNLLAEAAFFPQIEHQQRDWQGNGSRFGEAGKQEHGEREPVIMPAFSCSRQVSHQIAPK